MKDCKGCRWKVEMGAPPPHAFLGNGRGIGSAERASEVLFVELDDGCFSLLMFVTSELNLSLNISIFMTEGCNGYRDICDTVSSINFSIGSE